MAAVSGWVIPNLQINQPEGFMSVEHQKPPAAKPSAFLSFVENAVSVVAVVLIVIGLIAATSTWRATTVEFIGNDRLRITKSQWWRILKTTSIYHAGSNGRVVRLPNGEEKAVRSQPIKLRN